MRRQEIFMLMLMLGAIAGCGNISRANDEKTPEWVVEPVSERMAGMLAQGILYDIERRGIFLLPDERPRMWSLFSPEGELLASFEEPDRARRIVSDQRLLLGFATSNKIFPIIERGKLREPFETIDGYHVRGHHTQNQTLFARWGYSYPIPGRDTRPPLAGFTVYDQDGRIVLEKDEDSGFFFRQLLDEAVVVADQPSEWESRFKLVGFNGKVKATFGEPHSEEVRSSLFRQSGGEYVGVETTRMIDFEWKRTIEVYRQDGNRVAHIEDAEETTWIFHGHYFIGLSWDGDGWQGSFCVYDLRKGERVDFKYDLQTGRREGDEVVPAANHRTINKDAMHSNTFSGGERLMVIRLQDEERDDSFLRAFVLDVATSEIVWTGEPQKYRKEGENVEGYNIIARYIGDPVPGEPDALFIFTEEHGPSLIRRISHKKQ